MEIFQQAPKNVSSKGNDSHTTIFYWPMTLPAKLWLRCITHIFTSVLEDTTHEQQELGITDLLITEQSLSRSSTTKLPEHSDPEQLQAVIQIQLEKTYVSRQWLSDTGSSPPPQPFPSFAFNNSITQAHPSIVS